ncbi:MAG: hemolysin D [Thermoguttaceae bacterium]
MKDPVGLNYYRFQEEEFAILQMLDGQTSLDEIKERFEDEFPPQKITLEELQQFLGMLHRSGLVVVAVGGQGRQLLKRRTQRRHKELINALANILCIRFKGFDPERVLNWLYPRVRWFFTPTAVCCACLFILSAVMLVAVQFETFSKRLPAFHEFFNFYNALWLSLTLGLIKVIHEFGHGLTCKHFGGECHEMGIMILVLTPCLYCNVSDSWMLPNKWARAAIGAGGMYVELVLASICTYVWWYSEPGLLNHLCLNAMFVASVSTVIFNANPLLRYDGYYILADVAEIPNLRQKATTILSRKMGEWFLGLEQPDDPFLPERNQIFFALYSVAAAFYRWFVVLSILWFLYKIWKPYRLEIIGQIIAAMSLWGLLVMPLYQLGKFFYVPGRLEKVKKLHMFPSLAGLLAVLAAVALAPLPYSVMANLEIQPFHAEPVYVDVAEGGRLIGPHVKPGERVTKGQPLARLENGDLDLKIAELEGKKAGYLAQLDSLLRQGISDKKATAQIPEINEALKTVQQQLDEKNTDRDRLQLNAKKDGTVLPPPANLNEHQDPEGNLPSWSGTPLDPENSTAYLREGVLFCLVGDPAKLEAVLVIDQSDIELVRPGQKVDIKLDELPHDTLHSEILEIADSDLKITPRQLGRKGGGELATKTDPNTGVERPQDPSYQARAPLDDPDGLLRLGLRGRGKIHTDWMSLGSRLWRFVTHTFHFKL